jgi:hypothetical protein
MLQRLFLTLCVASCTLLVVNFPSSEAFTTAPSTIGRAFGVATDFSVSSMQKSRGRMVIFSSPEDELTSDTSGEPQSSPSAPTAVATPPTPAATDEESSYPIDLPSPILLAASMILAIVGTGTNERRLMGIAFFIWNVWIFLGFQRQHVLLMLPFLP